MKKTHLLASIAVTLVTIVSCKKDSGPQQQPRTDITAEKLAVKTYEIITLTSHDGLAKKYTGTYGSIPVELLKTSDTTLAFYVPEVATGEAMLKFDLAHNNFRVTRTTVTNPDKFITDLRRILKRRL